AEADGRQHPAGPHRRAGGRRQRGAVPRLGPVVVRHRDHHRGRGREAHVMRVFGSLDEFTQQVGRTLGSSDWLEITQDRVNLFADATGDHQWIHVDVERAKEGPFGGTISHGYLSLSLLPSLVKEIYRVEGLRLGINYGLNKVRFPRPVPVGSRVRAGAEILDVKDTPNGTLTTLKVTLFVEGDEKPACVAETLSLLVPQT